MCIELGDCRPKVAGVRKVDESISHDYRVDNN